MPALLLLQLVEELDKQLTRARLIGQYLVKHNIGKVEKLDINQCFHPKTLGSSRANPPFLMSFDLIYIVV